MLKSLATVGVAFVFSVLAVSCQDDAVAENTEALTGSSELTALLTGMAANAADCVTLAYPVTIFSYDSGFQVRDTYVANNDAELYAMLQGVGADEYYSVSYPVTININGADGFTVGDNNAFADAIAIAMQGCTLSDALIAYMTFANGAVYDLKGNSVSAPFDIGFTADRNGNENCAIIFNGKEHLHMQLSKENILSQGDAFSISLWFRMQNTNAGNLETLFAKGAEGDGFLLGVYDLNTPFFMAGEANVWDEDWNRDAALPVDTQNWHHIVVTADANGTVNLYRDGQLRGTVQGAAMGQKAMDYFIGNNFSGFMDDLRVYKKALLPAEITVLYQLEGDCSTSL